MASHSPTHVNIQTISDEGVVYCNHAVPAARLTAGPHTRNPGRVFWRCRTHSSEEGACNFFQWDDEIPVRRAATISTTQNNQNPKASITATQTQKAPDTPSRSTVNRPNPTSPFFRTSTPQAPAMQPSPAKSPERTAAVRQTMTPAQREQERQARLAAINSARGTPQTTASLLPAFGTAQSPTSNAPASHSRAPMTPAQPRPVGRLPAPDFSPALRQSSEGPAASRFKPAGLLSSTPANDNTTLNPGSATRRKVIADAWGISRPESSASRAESSSQRAETSTQTARNPYFYDEDDDRTLRMPGVFGQLVPYGQSQSVGTSLDEGADADMGGASDDDQELNALRGMTEEERFFASTPNKQGMVTPPDSSLRPRLGREMAADDEDDGMSVEDDDGSVLGISGGKGKERQRSSQSVVEEDLKGFTWEEFEASQGPSSNEHGSIPILKHSAAGTPGPHLSQHSDHSQQQVASLLSWDGRVTAAEVREMLRRLQGVPDAMEAQEREIEFWKQRAVSLEQDKKKLDRAFRDYISAHSSP